MSLEVGFGKHDITVFEPGMPMLGWGQEQNVSLGVAHPLYARAAAFRARDRIVVYVVCDLCFIAAALRASGRPDARGHVRVGVIVDPRGADVRDEVAQVLDLLVSPRQAHLRHLERLFRQDRHPVPALLAVRDRPIAERGQGLVGEPLVDHLELLEAHEVG